MTVHPASPIASPASAKPRRPRRRKARMPWLLQAALLLVAIAFFAPLVVVVSSSFSSEKAISTDGYGLIPNQFSTFAYQYILGDPTQLLTAYGVSILVTSVGTILSLAAMSLLAYSLSRPEFRLRKPISFYVMFTMLFGGGLVPSYILITRYLDIGNTVLALILPYLITPWYVLLLRTYFTQLPQDILDAARIDGAGEWKVFLRIAVPLSKPALATVGLFVLLLYWNDWWLGLLYITQSDLVPVQLYLYRILSSADYAASNAQLAGQAVDVPIQTVRMAASVLAIGPVVIAFFAVQRFLVRGITVGGIKD